MYSVQVANAYGSTNSADAVLTVNMLSCLASPSGIVGWWRGENDATDSAGNNNGIVVSNVSYTSGEVGQGFLFTQLGQDVKIPANSNLDLGLGGGLSLEAWINTSDVATNYNTIMEWNVGDGVTYWGVQMYVIPAGTLYANIQGLAGDTWHQMYSASGIVAANSFQHVALTYDKASGVARLYYNGVVAAQTSFGSFTPKTTGDLHIGRRPLSPSNDELNFFGIIDEPAVYNRALTSNEIASIFSVGVLGKCPPAPTPPSITSQPLNQMVISGNDASFCV